MSSYFNAHQKRSIFALSRLRPSMLIDNIKIAHILIRERTQSCLSGKNTAWIGKELAENFQKNEFAVLLKLENFLVSRSQHSFTSCRRRRTCQIAFPWKPIRSRSIPSFKIFRICNPIFPCYSYRQNGMHCCIPPTDCQFINQEESVTCFLLKNRTIYSRTWHLHKLQSYATSNSKNEDKDFLWKIFYWSFCF